MVDRSTARVSVHVDHDYFLPMKLLPVQTENPLLPSED